MASRCYHVIPFADDTRHSGYLAPVVVITASYALFQTANNTAVMTDVSPNQRGAISGMLNLSRNLGLITGASVMGAVFAFGSATSDITTASPDAVAIGMRITFAVAAALIVVALAISAAAYRRTFRNLEPASINDYRDVAKESSSSPGRTVRAFD
jgi:MFS family permease